MRFTTVIAHELEQTDKVYSSEPRHDKANNIVRAPSEDSDASAQSDQSSLCTQWVANDPSFLHADSEDW